MVELHWWFDEISGQVTYQKSKLCRSGSLDSFLMYIISRKKKTPTASQCGNLIIFPPQFFAKNSIKLTFSLKNYTVSQFDEKFFKWGKISEITTLWHHCIAQYGNFAKSLPFSNFRQTIFLKMLLNLAGKTGLFSTMYEFSAITYIMKNVDNEPPSNFK